MVYAPYPFLLLLLYKLMFDSLDYLSHVLSLSLSLCLCVFQGQWGTTSNEEEVDMRLRGTFVEEKVPSLRSEFVVLHDSFKVQCIILL